MPQYYFPSKYKNEYVKICNELFVTCLPITYEPQEDIITKVVAWGSPVITHYPSKRTHQRGFYGTKVFI